MFRVSNKTNTGMLYSVFLRIHNIVAWSIIVLIFFFYTVPHRGIRSCDAQLSHFETARNNSRHVQIITVQKWSEMVRRRDNVPADFTVISFVSSTIASLLCIRWRQPKWLPPRVGPSRLQPPRLSDQSFRWSSPTRHR